MDIESLRQRQLRFNNCFDLIWGDAGVNVLAGRLRNQIKLTRFQNIFCVLREFSCSLACTGLLEYQLELFLEVLEYFFSFFH